MTQAQKEVMVDNWFDMESTMIYEELAEKLWGDIQSAFIDEFSDAQELQHIANVATQ